MMRAMNRRTFTRAMAAGVTAAAVPGWAAAQSKKLTIGITTLIMQVPLDVALAHQAMALVVLGFAAAHWRGTKGSYKLPTAIAVRS